MTIQVEQVTIIAPMLLSALVPGPINFKPQEAQPREDQARFQRCLGGGHF